MQLVCWLVGILDSRAKLKVEIKSAIERLFKVKVKAVNTLVRKGKLKTFRGRRALQGDTKKAIVTLVEGHTIDLATGL